MTEKIELMVAAPRWRYENYRFLAIVCGLDLMIRTIAELIRDGWTWAEVVFAVAFAFVMVVTLWQAYDDRRRRLAGDLDIIPLDSVEP